MPGDLKSRKLWPWFLGSLGLLMTLWPMLSTLGRYTPGDPGDMRFCSYLLEHGYRWVMRWPGYSSFWDPPFFHPVPNVLAYSETLLGSAPLYWVWRWLAIPPDHSFQLWLITVLSLDFAVFYLWARRDFALNRLPSATGAFLFTFSNPRVVQIGHPQLLPHFFTPIAIMALARVFRAPQAAASRRWVPVFFLASAFQLWAGFYLGWFLAMGCMTAAVGWIARPEGRARLLEVLRIHGMRATLWAGVAGLMVSPLVMHSLQAMGEVGAREFGAVDPWIPTLASWLYPGGLSWLYRWLELLKPFRDLVNAGIAHEHALGLGLATTAMAFVGFREALRGGLRATRGWPTLKLLVLVALVFFVALTKFYPHITLWRVLYGIVPGAGGIRTVSRVGLVTLMPTAICAAVFFERRKTAAPALLLLLAICVVEQGHWIPHFDRSILSAKIQDYSAEVDPRHCRYFFFSPRFLPDAFDQPGYRSHVMFNMKSTRHANWVYQMDSLLIAQRTGVPTINGYSGNFPPGWMAGLYDNVIESQRDLERIGRALDRWVALKGLAREGLCWIKPQVREE